MARGNFLNSVEDSLRRVCWKFSLSYDFQRLPDNAGWDFELRNGNFPGGMNLRLNSVSDRAVTGRIKKLKINRQVDKTPLDLYTYLRQAGRLLLRQAPGCTLDVFVCQRPEHPTLWQAGFLSCERFHADMLLHIPDGKETGPELIPLALAFRNEKEAQKEALQLARYERVDYTVLGVFDAAAGAAASEIRRNGVSAIAELMQNQNGTETCRMFFEACQGQAEGYKGVCGQRIFLAPRFNDSPRDANGAIRLTAADARAMDAAFAANWEMDAACLSMHPSLKEMDEFGGIKVSVSIPETSRRWLFLKSLDRALQMGRFLPEQEREKWGGLLTDRVIRETTEHISTKLMKLMEWRVWADCEEFMSDDRRARLQEQLDGFMRGVEKHRHATVKAEALDEMMDVAAGASHPNGLHFLRQTSGKGMLQEMASHYPKYLGGYFYKQNRMILRDIQSGISAPLAGEEAVKSLGKMAKLFRMEGGEDLIGRTLLDHATSQDLNGLRENLQEILPNISLTSYPEAQEGAAVLHNWIECLLNERRARSVMAEAAPSLQKNETRKNETGARTQLSLFDDDKPKEPARETHARPTEHNKLRI